MNYSNLGRYFKSLHSTIQRKLGCTLSLIEFSYNNIYHSSIEMAPFKALYGRYYRTSVCWDEVGERKLYGPELIQRRQRASKWLEKILKISHDRQKSYANNRHKVLEFEVGNKVFLKSLPWKGVIRFRRKEKLSPRFIGPYEILARVGLVDYKLRLPAELSKIHNVFYLSMLQKYIPDSSHILQEQPLEVKEKLDLWRKNFVYVRQKGTSIENKGDPYGQGFVEQPCQWGSHFGNWKANES